MLLFPEPVQENPETKFKSTIPGWNTWAQIVVLSEWGAFNTIGNEQKIAGLDAKVESASNEIFH